MTLLALDTATPRVTVAVADDSIVLAESNASGGRRHGELLAPLVHEVLEQAGIERGRLSAVAVGTGPGPFTGLRVGLVTARVLGATLGIPVLGVCTLDVLAFAAVASGLQGPFRVATDARRREVYWAAYQDGRRISGPAVDSPVAVPGSGPVVGDGAWLYPEAFPDAREPRLPAASALAAYVAAGGATTAPDPLYLRRPDIAEPSARKSVLT